MQSALHKPQEARGERQKAVCKLSVIAPCLNEEGNIDALVDRTLGALDSMGVTGQFVLVDDGSRDRTWELICASAARDGRVCGVRHARNQGMVPAWRSGLQAATGELVCIIDADLQNRPEDIPRLYEAYQARSIDVVQAVRHPSRGQTRILMLSRGLNRLLNLTFGMHSRDNKSGFIICPREVLSHSLEHRYRYRHFQNLLGVALHTRGYTIGEVDTDFDERRRGDSFLSTFPVTFCSRILWEIVKYRIETLRHAERPLGRDSRLLTKRDSHYGCRGQAPLVPGAGLTTCITARTNKFVRGTLPTPTEDGSLAVGATRDSPTSNASKP